MTNSCCNDKLKSYSSKFKESFVEKHQKKDSSSTIRAHAFLAILVAIFLIDAGLGDVIWSKGQVANVEVWTCLEWAFCVYACFLAVWYCLRSHKGKKAAVAKSPLTKKFKVDNRARCVEENQSSRPSSSVKPTFSSQNDRDLIDQAAQNGDVQRALALFREMEHRGARPDAWTPNMVMRAFTKKGDLAGAERWLAEMKEKGMEVSACTYNTILDACVKLDKPELCEKWVSRMTFDGIPPTAITFATLMAAHARRGNVEKATALFEDMKSAGVPPDDVCYNSLIHACSIRGNIRGAAYWVDEMIAAGCQPSVTTFTAAIDACAKRGMVDEAESWMHRMVAAGLQPNVVSYSSLMDACAKVGQPERAGVWYDKMIEVGVTPNSYTFSAAIAACGKAGDVAAAEAWLARAEATSTGVASDPVLYSCTIDACAKTNDADRAWRVFERMRARGVRPHIVTYATLARPFAERGDYHKVEQLEQMMVAEGIAVNEYFLYAQLIAYGKARPKQTAKASEAFKRHFARGLRMNDRILLALRRVLGRENANALHEKAKAAQTNSA
mmetsp:Transcript_20836/g.33197  ORF Transcript_20836/g.33197 Transcript_20836/m.33197 type:complete len:555 (-) Transcript_20836:71-1735(-)